MIIALGATCGGDRHTRGARFRLASPSPPPQMRRGVNTWAFRLGHVAGRPPPNDSSARTQPTAASPGTGARGRRGRQRRQCCVGGEGRRAVGAASPEPGPRGRAPFRSLLAVATSSGTVARSCFCCFTEGRGSLSLIILRVGRPHPRRRRRLGRAAPSPTESGGSQVQPADRGPAGSETPRHVTLRRPLCPKHVLGRARTER